MSFLDRVAGAPISWGVCEVPGWGHQLEPARVLTEMREVGLVATELGPDGFLPDEPQDKARVLAEHGLRAVGAFVPVVLHDSDVDPSADAGRALEGLVASGSDVIVLSAATGAAGYDTRPELDERGWDTLLANLDRLAAQARERGVKAVLHPHVGTMVEQEAEVRRVLDGCDIPLCLDTGHLLIGGTDPAALAREVPGRIAHVHLKDVDAAMAERVRGGELTYTEGVRQGMYRPLGAGDVDIAAIVTSLEDDGYNGWYVLEQDTILPTEPEGEGPVVDVRASIEHLRSVAAAR